MTWFHDLLVLGLETKKYNRLVKESLLFASGEKPILNKVHSAGIVLVTFIIYDSSGLIQGNA